MYMNMCVFAMKDVDTICVLVAVVCCFHSHCFGWPQVGGAEEDGGSAAPGINSREVSRGMSWQPLRHGSHAVTSKKRQIMYKPISFLYYQVEISLRYMRL